MRVLVLLNVSIQISWFGKIPEQIVFISSDNVSETCHLNFSPDLDGLGNMLSRVTISEDDVARQQVEEDLRLYGSRPEPPDVIEVDEATQLTGLPPKRSASDFEAAIDRQAKFRKKGESQTYNHHAITAIDWNSGASPLDSWLNQSAIPSTIVNYSQDISEPPADDPITQEVEEIKVFRNVHIGVEPKIIRQKADTNQDFVDSMELGAQIYYRNIMDRFPLLPAYLAHRLAQANHERAERVRLRRHGAQPPPIIRDGDQVMKTAPGLPSPFVTFPAVSIVPPVPYLTEPANSRILPSIPDLTSPLVPMSVMGQSNSRTPSSTQKKHKCKICDKRFTRPSSLQTHMYSHTGEKPYACLAEGCGRRFSVVKNLRRHSKTHKGDGGSGHSSNYATQFSNIYKPDSSDFWTGLSTHRRSSSIRSYSSSRNSSLRGDPTFGPQEQEPSFLTDHPRSSSVDFEGIPLGLLLPLIVINKKLSIECDICRDIVRVDGKHDWQ